MNKSKCALTNYPRFSAKTATEKNPEQFAMNCSGLLLYSCTRLNAALTGTESGAD